MSLKLLIDYRGADFALTRQGGRLGKGYHIKGQHGFTEHTVGGAFAKELQK